MGYLVYEEMDPNWVLHFVGVDRGYGNRGFGTKLVKRLILLAHKLEIPRIGVYALQDACGFFEKFGF